MKKIVLFLLALMFLVTAASATYVRGYFRSSGTYVAPHYRSRANSITYDNYSYKPSRIKSYIYE